MNTASAQDHERARLVLQAVLDSEKTQAARNKLGQFATPTALATEILRYAGSLLSVDEPIRFMDPAIGTGSFYSALRTAYPPERIAVAKGFEIDPHYGSPAMQLWAGSGLRMEIADFTRQQASPEFNMLICNPPYVRHHHMTNDEKRRLHRAGFESAGVRLGGLSGLYCYFMALADKWMTSGGIAGWLVPSEFMDVNYGQALKRYLLDRVTLLHIHRFDPDDVQFADALVSSAVVWFRKQAPPADHSVKFTFGGTLAEPKISRDVAVRALSEEMKWTRFPNLDVRAKNASGTVSDFFSIKRGIATGDNGFFILPRDEIDRRELPMQAFRPILPSPRYVKGDEITAGADGLPQLEKQLFLLDPGLPEHEIEQQFPGLFAYLQEGRQRGLHERYLCRHRTTWYAQEARPPAPIVCTYMGRSNGKSGRPFRFILNNSTATVANVYLAMYPTALTQRAMQVDPGFLRRAWGALNRIKPDELLGEGRVYGGGLHKLEPKELANVPMVDLVDMLPLIDRIPKQADLFAAIAAE